MPFLRKVVSQLTATEPIKAKLLMLLDNGVQMDRATVLANFPEAPPQLLQQAVTELITAGKLEIIP